jgi:hypothetical protein
MPGHRWWKAIPVNVYEFFSAADESRPSHGARNRQGERAEFFNVRNRDEAVACWDAPREVLGSIGTKAGGARYKEGRR